MVGAHVALDEALGLELAQSGGEQAVGDAGDRGAVLGEPAGAAHAGEQDRRVPLAAGELDGRLESAAGRLVDVPEVLESGVSRLPIAALASLTAW